MSAFTKAFPKAVRELRLLGCQTGAGSAGLREFIASTYPSIKSANPNLPVLIREAQGTPARVFVRYGPSVVVVVFLGLTNAASSAM
ncbi:hypothetical protein FRC06_002191 [Ceratobasidium sp. 370]|nr:hypothetical protein FRC06_002191 [Ceratobasidium sp. 370]